MKEILLDILTIYITIVAIMAIFSGVWRRGLVKGGTAALLLPFSLFFPETVDRIVRGILGDQ